MKREKLQNIYPMTPMQEGMLFHTLMEGEDGEAPGAYLEQCLISIDGDLDSELLQRSFQLLVDRHEVFRSIFLFENVKQPLQVVLNQRKFKLTIEDLSPLELSWEERQPRMETFTLENRRKGFDLSKDLLMRATLFKFSDRRYSLMWSYHHIIMDGWSLSIVFGDLMRIYRGLTKREPKPLETPIPYNDYIQWLKGQGKEAGLNYWKGYLEGYEQSSVLPRTNRRENGEMAGYSANQYRFRLDETLSRNLESLAASLGVTVNSCFQTLWGLLLQRYNNTHDVVFGIVVSGRPSEIEGVEQLVGLFINTVPLRIKVNRDIGFNRLVHEVRVQSADSSPFHYVSLAEIQAHSDLKGELIHHIMAFENYPVEESIRQLSKEGRGEKGFRITDVQLMESTHYDFNMIITPGNRYTVTFRFNANVHDEG
ncbi:MAG: hypothetical protein GY940_34295, partial [bacterium]|nr:hypothetical protein [bacterium]